MYYVYSTHFRHTFVQCTSQSRDISFLSQPLVMHLACVNLHLTMPEALAAATINAAASLGLSHTHGSLEVGKNGDMVLLNCDKLVTYGSSTHSLKLILCVCVCRVCGVVGRT